MCKSEGCQGPDKQPGSARGYCLKHYVQWQRENLARPCAVGGCDDKTGFSGTGHGYCGRHYHLWQKYGEPEPAHVRVMGLPTADRIRKISVVNPVTGCWEWPEVQRVLRSHYGTMMMSDGRRSQRAHRMSYETFVGPLVKGLVIDHLCNVRWCVNPEHLEQITQAENIKRRNARLGWVDGGASRRVADRHSTVSPF